MTQVVLSNPQQFIAYYRVSTQKQGKSGLGLEAQQAAVKQFAQHGTVIAEFTDIETGSNDLRPQLLAAIALAKKTGARMLVAKLDRLSRELHFITELQRSDIKFTCCDMPDATEFTIHIIAAVAQHERRMIQQRTSAALQAKKARGCSLGNPGNFTQEGRSSGAKARKEAAVTNPYNVRATAMAKSLLSTGMTLSKVAEELNKAAFKTSGGSIFRAEQVRRLLLRDKHAA